MLWAPWTMIDERYRSWGEGGDVVVVVVVVVSHRGGSFTSTLLTWGLFVLRFVFFVGMLHIPDGSAMLLCMVFLLH